MEDSGGHDRRYVQGYCYCRYIQQETCAVSDRIFQYDAFEEFARAAHLYVLENGRDAALAALSDPSGPYYNEGCKIVALDNDGTVLSWPYDPTRAGVNLLGATDVYGGSFVRDLIRTAKGCGGFEYVYLPIQSESRSKLQLQYTLPVDDAWFVSAGVPLY